MEGGSNISPIDQISYIEISAFIHATEDREKVLEAFRNLLPEGYLDKVEVKSSGLSGYFHNPITLLRTRVEDKMLLEPLIEKMAASLIEEEKALLASDLMRRMDEQGALYIRLDKQEALQGKVRLQQSDPIRIKIKPYRYGKSLEELAEVYRSLNLL